MMATAREKPDGAADLVTAPVGFRFFAERGEGHVHLTRGDRLLCSRAAVPEHHLAAQVARARTPCRRCLHELSYQMGWRPRPA